MLITSEQTGQFILRSVISFTVIFALHDEHITVFCGAGTPGNGGNIPGAGGIGNSPGAGGIGNSPGAGTTGRGGKSSNLGRGRGANSPGGGNSPGAGRGGRFLDRFSKISLAYLSFFLFILRSRRLEAFPASTLASNSSDRDCSASSSSSR